ncbi:MAG: dephospho-CoA kinase [Bdellovibrionaceae bacterium]|nr:dephospho-CoA kinase [Pseudobdellovibrionaceae bacterium]
MLWIGLTGGMGTGKSTVASILRELGYPVIDADAFSHKSLERSSECYNHVVKLFGDQILDAKGDIDRKKLGEIVFSNKRDLTKLENIIHPYVQKKADETRREYESSGHKIAFYDVPLLFEKELQNKFDKTVLVYAPNDLQVQRIVHRDNMNIEEIQKRIAAQISIEDKKEMADVVINNLGSIAELKKEINNTLKELI